jgi:hypothetical protein
LACSTPLPLLPPLLPQPLLRSPPPALVSIISGSENNDK